MKLVVSLLVCLSGCVPVGPLVTAGAVLTGRTTATAAVQKTALKAGAKKLVETTTEDKKKDEDERNRP